MISLCHKIVDRARWELKEWRTPSRRSFLQEELDQAVLHEVRWLTGERVLDVGCAHGEYMQVLADLGVRVSGIDVSLSAVKSANAFSDEVVVASGDALPFADASFDALLCHKTMHLFESPDRVIDEFRRVLKPGGRVVFSGSNNRSPYARTQAVAIRMTGNRNWGYANRLSIRDWIEAFGRHGMRIKAVYSCNLIWPLVFRVCDRWVIPNEWMRRYNHFVRRVSRTPLKTRRPLAVAQDYVVEIEKPGESHSHEAHVLRGISEQ